MLSAGLVGGCRSQNYSIQHSSRRTLDKRSLSAKTQCNQELKFSSWIRPSDSQLLMKLEFYSLKCFFFEFFFHCQLLPFGCQTSWHNDGIINSADKIRIHLACIVAFWWWKTTKSCVAFNSYSSNYFRLNVLPSLTQSTYWKLTTEFCSQRPRAYKRKMVFPCSCAIENNRHRLDQRWNRQTKSEKYSNQTDNLLSMKKHLI